MKTFHENDIRKRALIIGLALTAWFGVILLKLVQLQVFGHAEYAERATKQSQNRRKIQPRRGNITDRNHKILGSSLSVFSVVMNPVKDEAPDASKERLVALLPALDLSRDDVSAVLEKLRRNNIRTYVARRIPQEQKKAVADLIAKKKLEGFELENGTMRYYPNGSLAAHVLGGVNSEEKGWAGVELFYNDELSGESGEEIAFSDRDRRTYETQVLKAAVPGRDLELTIDASLQFFAEDALAAAVEQHSATWGTIVISVPRTGEILAMASLPSYDPNKPSSDAEARRNRAVQYGYEPGSTFKIITAAAALERHLVSYSDWFDCSAGSITIGGRTIRDHESMGSLTFPQVLIKSSNVGTVLFSRRLAMQDFFDTIKTFGIGQRTGIDLPAEDPGILHPVAEWNKLFSVPHVAIGYEVRVTPLQILRAMNVYATRGTLVRPRIVKEIGGKPPARAAGPDPKIMTADTASELVSRALEKVVDEGTGKDGRLEGYSIAGKTGTAQVFDKELNAYTTKQHIASFVGFVPAERPALTIVVVLADPKEGIYYGGQVCAPIFRDIAKQALLYLHIPPDRPREVVEAAARKKNGKDGGT
jgi:cell division protein FtsI/penicillin-binding protein 2